MADDRTGVAPSRPTPLLVTAALLALASVAWYASNLPGAWAPFLIGWTLPTASAIVAAVACWRTSTAPGITADAGRFWRRLRLAVVVFGVASLSNAHDASTGAVVPNQRISGLTMVPYLYGILVVLWALLRLPRTIRPTPAEHRRFWLDTAVVVITTGVFLWHLLFRQVADWTARSGSPSTVLAIVLIASVAALAFTKLGLTGAGAVDPRSLHILALAAVAGAAGGALAPITADRLHLSNVILATPPAMALLVVAADRQRRAARLAGQPARRRRRAFSLVPYAAVTATDLLLVATAHGGGREAVVVAVAAVLLTGIVVYRQIDAFTENSRLLHRVDASVLELRDAQRQLAHRANHDDLTGLPNRRLFEERLGRALDAARSACVVLIDLDDFKRINDRLGHSLGDAVLIIVGRRLQSCVRGDDTVARFGGDEFALLLGDVSADGAASVLRRLSTALEQPVSVGEHDLLVQSSIGIVEAAPGADATELLRRADLAMYAAKERGKGRHVCYDPALDRQAATDAVLGAELRLALDRGEFHLLYQPLVRLPDGRPAGAEALVRWRHPDRGLVPPDLFISASERTGLIVPIGAWILNEACRQAGEWLRAYGDRLSWKVSVNISARQLREPGFAGHVSAALEAAGLPAERLMVEVTETAVFDNEAAVVALTEISELGVSVALDDFGTGHSSLGLLRTTPVDVLKVDKSFVQGITGSTEEAVIATAMIQITEGLHLGAVAEGVETLAQAERLHQLGYRLAQGFYFAKPLPPAEVGLMLANSLPRDHEVGASQTGVS